MPTFIRLPPHLVPRDCPEQVETPEEIAQLWRAAVAALDQPTPAMVGHYLHDVVRLYCEHRGLSADDDLARRLFSEPTRLAMAARMLTSPRWLEDDDSVNLWSVFQLAFVLLTRIEALETA